MKAHIVDLASDLIVNTIEVRDLNFPVGKDQELVEAIADEGIGWAWNNGEPIRPVPKPVPKSDIELRIEALEAAKVDLDTRLKAVEEKPVDAEITRLRAEVAKMDLDGDGSIGGSKPRA